MHGLFVGSLECWSPLLADVMPGPPLSPPLWFWRSVLSILIPSRKQTQAARQARIAATAEEEHPESWAQQRSSRLQHLQSWSKESPKGRFKNQEHLTLVEVIAGSDEGAFEGGQYALRAGYQCLMMSDQHLNMSQSEPI